MTAIIMRNKFTKLLTCVQLMITLVSFVSPAPANIPSDLKKEWMSNLCHFPPVDLYFEVPADDQQSLKKCVNNLKSEEERIPLCDKFVKSLNNNTCKKKVYEKELIISTLKKSNATEIKKYCNGLLSSSFKNKECEEVCTEDKFTKDMCLLIYFAKNITETALQVSSSTPKTTAATPPTSTGEKNN
ncbi:uncharacterized protein LOC134278717, partial [Saccostrea cucullata]|uniref:uncharacterized protein LOC134278717 n=1 Tax=Saccostrea cuccullata TaxID=36930 RepID=UPI002ED0B02F